MRNFCAHEFTNAGVRGKKHTLGPPLGQWLLVFHTDPGVRKFVRAEIHSWQTDDF
jgi:hypothetical protein